MEPGGNVAASVGVTGTFVESGVGETVGGRGVELDRTGVPKLIVGEDEGRNVEVGLVVNPGVSLGGDTGEPEAVGVFSTISGGLGEEVVLGEGSSWLLAASLVEVVLGEGSSWLPIASPVEVVLGEGSS
jgi:hypothetical protein